jgi:hypothetical protein
MSDRSGIQLWDDLRSRRLRPHVLAVALLWTSGGVLMVLSFMASGRARPITFIGTAFLVASILPWFLWVRGRKE